MNFFRIIWSNYEGKAISVAISIAATVRLLPSIYAVLACCVDRVMIYRAQEECSEQRMITISNVECVVLSKMNFVTQPLIRPPY